MTAYDCIITALSVSPGVTGTQQGHRTHIRNEDTSQDVYVGERTGTH